MGGRQSGRTLLSDSLPSVRPSGRTSLPAGCVSGPSRLPPIGHRSTPPALPLPCRLVFLPVLFVPGLPVFPACPGFHPGDLVPASVARWHCPLVPHNPDFTLDSTFPFSVSSSLLIALSLYRNLRQVPCISHLHRCFSSSDISVSLSPSSLGRPCSVLRTFPLLLFLPDIPSQIPKFYAPCCLSPCACVCLVRPSLSSTYSWYHPHPILPACLLTPFKFFLFSFPATPISPFSSS